MLSKKNQISNEIDDKLDNLIEDSVINKIKYPSYTSIAKKLKLGHKAITASEERKKKIDQANIIKKDVDTRLEKFIQNAVKNNIKYLSYMQIAEESDISYFAIKGIKERVKKIDQANIIEKDIDTKLEKFIQNAVKNNIKYSNYSDIIESLGVHRASIDNHDYRKKKIDRAKIIIEDTDIKLDKFIKNAVKKGIKYPSYNSIAGNLGVSFNTIKKHKLRKEKIDQANIVIEDVDIKLDKFIKNAIEKNIIYSSYTDLAEKLGVGHTSIMNSKERKERIDQANIVKKDIDTNLDNLIKNAIKEGIVYLSFTHLAKELGSTVRTIKSSEERKEKIDRANIIKENIDSKIDQFIKNAINMNIKYPSYTNFAEELGINANTITNFPKRKEKIDRANLIEDSIDVRLDKFITNAIEKGIKYSSFTHIAEELGVNTTTISVHKARKEKIINSKITSKSNLNLETDNTLFIISYCSENGIKINLDNESFYEYAYELHDIKIQEKGYFIEQISAIYPDIFISYDKFKLLEFAKKILTYLSIEDNENLLWHLTIKLEFLYRHNIYISDQTLKELFIAMGLEVETIFIDNIENRLAYASKLAEYDYARINFTDELPEINTFDCPQVISQIKDTENFYTYWKKYITWFLKNKLYSSHVSKHQIESNWDENLENLINKAPRFGKVFFLDNSQNSELFKKLGHKGVSALSFYAAKKLKKETGEKERGIAQEYEGLRACASGFFLWLLREEKALSSPKFVRLLGNTKITDIAKAIISNHKINNYHNTLLEAENSTENKNKINKENVYLHSLYFGSATKYSFNIASVTREQFDDYLNISQLYAKPSGTISHESYLELLGIANNNINAKRFKEKITISEYLNKQLESCDPHTMNLYSDLLREFKELITKRFQGSRGYMFQLARSIPYLIDFLSLYKKKLTRNEMSNALNTIITTRAEYNIEKFLQGKISDYLYKTFISYYYKLFQATTIEEYHGVIQESWKIKSKRTNDNENRSFIRSGLPVPIYKLLQDIAIKAPVYSILFEFRKTAPTGEPLDLSWWKHETSPIPAVCLWLMTKIPRRSAHITSLDVNRFIVDGKDGKFRGLYFNTDKNPDFARIGRDFIDLFSCKKLFSDFEIDFLKKYVKYIKDAYSDMIEVEYKNGGNYKKILPLFPSKDGRDTISYEHLTNIFNKTLMKTQIIAREKAREGFFNNEYDNLNQDDKVMKLEELKNINLIKFRDENNENNRIIPNTLEEFEKLNYSDGIYKTGYQTIDYGIHTLRVSGASKLLADGVDINTIMNITAHANLNVLASVYLKPDDLTAIQVIKRMNPDIDFGDTNINNPIQICSKFIRHKIMPLIESENPDEVLKQLRGNNFQCVAASIISTNKIIYRDIGETYVDYGLEIASKYHPTSSWVNKTYGICTIGEQCPQGTGGICSVCPHLMFNAMHIKGVINKINNIVLDINLLQRKKVESYSNPTTNSALNEITSAHQIKISEYFGYINILSSIKAQISRIASSNLAENDPQALVSTFAFDDLIGIKENSLIEMRMDIAAAAMELNIKDIYNDDNIANVSYELLNNAIQKNSLATIKELQEHTISSFIKRYSECDIAKKREFILQYFVLEDETTKLTNNTNFLPKTI